MRIEHVRNNSLQYLIDVHPSSWLALCLVAAIIRFLKLLSSPERPKVRQFLKRDKEGERELATQFLRVFRAFLSNRIFKEICCRSS